MFKAFLWDAGFIAVFTRIKTFKNFFFSWVVGCCFLFVLLRLCENTFESVDWRKSRLLIFRGWTRVISLFRSRLLKCRGARERPSRSFVVFHIISQPARTITGPIDTATPFFYVMVQIQQLCYAIYKKNKSNETHFKFYFVYFFIS